MSKPAMSANPFHALDNSSVLQASYHTYWEIIASEGDIMITVFGAH